MKVRVRLFAVLADWAGTNELTLELPESATGEELFTRLEAHIPRVKELKNSLRLAVNREYVPWSAAIESGDEIAIIPPVSGGLGPNDGEEELPFVEVVRHPLSADVYQRRVLSPHCGAVALFVGVVREFTHGRRTVQLQYEAYDEMAVKEMRALAAEMMEKWPMARVAMGHRVGELGIGEASVIVAVATPHRQEAFEAARYGIDTLKERVPIWKKEVWDDGAAWVGIDA